MKQRLTLLDGLMADNGVILVQIDKEQSAYLKVLMDEVFGRDAYITTIAVRMSVPSLLVKNDKLPVYQINPAYTFEMLCEAICKIEGFRYKPDDVFHGYSSEKRFIHVTLEFINAEYIKSLSAHLTDGQSLLIYGTKIQSDMILPDNIEVKKIPKDLLEKCDFESKVR